MPCECLTYECIEVKFNPCSEGAQLPLIADATGTWTMEIEFNGMWREADFGVVADQAVVIPTEFLNEYYTHKVLFYLNGELINDTCYKIKSRSMTSAGTFAPISPDQLAEILAELALHAEQIADLEDADVAINSEITSINENLEIVNIRLTEKDESIQYEIPETEPTDPFTIVTADIVGKYVLSVGGLSSQLYTRDNHFTQAGDTLTFISGIFFEPHDITLITYNIS